MLSKKLSPDKKLLFLIFAGMFLVMLLLTALTPMLADDYSYSFSYADRSRIDSVRDIFLSLNAHRDSMNGRMVSHFFAHLFLLLPKLVFCVVNALVFTLIIFLIYLTIRSGNDRRDLLLMLIALFLIWLYTPVFGQVFLWLDGACNYSWAFLFIFAFLYPYCSAYLHKRRPFADNPCLKVLYVLLSFLAGAYSEGASFAMLFVAFCFILCIWRRDKKLSSLFLVAFAVACLGYLYLMTAPSEWNGRTGSFSPLLITKNIKRIISAPYETMLPLFLLYAPLLAACICFKVHKEVIVTSVILFLGAWASIALFAVAIYFPWRSLLMMAILLVIACVLMLSALCELGFGRFLPMAAAFIGTLFIFQFALGVGDIAYVYNQYRQREAAIETAIQAGENQVWLDVYQADTKYSGAWLLADIYEDCWSWPNYDLAAYYGIEQVYALPAPEA